MQLHDWAAGRILTNQLNATTGFLVVDAESVKNTDSAEHKGYGTGEKVVGNKRHIANDTQGLPLPSPRQQRT